MSQRRSPKKEQLKTTKNEEEKRFVNSQEGKPLKHNFSTLTEGAEMTEKTLTLLEDEPHKENEADNAVIFQSQIFEVGEWKVLSVDILR